MPTDTNRPSASDRRPPRRGVKLLLILAVVLVAVVGAYVAASAYTSRPAFCNVCHEMTPYYSAWQAGPHAEVSCVDCHVDPGVMAGLAHKLVALEEVWLHYTTDPTFPLASAIDLPNERCTRCHSGRIDPKIANFDHEVHRKGAACKTCHDSVGHAVTAEALQAAGILNADVQAQRDSRTLGTGTGTTLAGHTPVACSSCHDMANSSCSACHTPPADHFPGECSACHTPSQPFASATFNHPSVPGGEHTYRSFECAKCHPAGPPAVNCTCHGGNPPSEGD